jgi:hypothetical protein
MNAPSQPAAAGRTLRARERFERLGLGIRCAYNPQQPAVIRCWLALGARLVRSGVEPEAPLQRRMLNLLLRTAQDDALPWFWRRVCLEHAAWPAARLRSLLGERDAAAAAAVHAAVQQAEDALAALPPHQARREGRAAP